MQNLISATSQEIILICLFDVLICKIWHKNSLLPNKVDYVATDNLYGFTVFTCEQWPIHVISWLAGMNAPYGLSNWWWNAVWLKRLWKKTSSLLNFQA